MIRPLIAAIFLSLFSQPSLGDVSSDIPRASSYLSHFKSLPKTYVQKIAITNGTKAFQAPIGIAIGRNSASFNGYFVSDLGACFLSMYAIHGKFGLRRARGSFSITCDRTTVSGKWSTRGDWTRQAHDLLGTGWSANGEKISFEVFGLSSANLLIKDFENYISALESNTKGQSPAPTATEILMPAQPSRPQLDFKQSNKNTKTVEATLDSNPATAFCRDLQSLAKSTNNELPRVIDNVTTAEKIVVDCNKKEFIAVKSVIHKLAEFDLANPFWRSKRQVDFNQKVCSNGDIKLLLQNDWKVLDEFVFRDQSVERIFVNCDNANPEPNKKIRQPDYSNELLELKRQRELIQSQLNQMQSQMRVQENIRNRQYNSCYSSCLMNNKAGRGFSAALQGLSQCQASCSPVLSGGVSVPPNWNSAKTKLNTIECEIRRISNRDFSASCSQ